MVAGHLVRLLIEVGEVGNGAHAVDGRLLEEARRGGCPAARRMARMAGAPPRRDGGGCQGEPSLVAPGTFLGDPEVDFGALGCLPNVPPAPEGAQTSPYLRLPASDPAYPPPPP